jgi:hypothetical protein
VYGSWGAGVVSRGDQWVKGGYASTGQGTVGGIRTSEGGAVVKGQNNTYVGKDGNVYRKNESGWSKYENGAWSPADRKQGGAASQLPAQGGSPQQGAVADRAGQAGSSDVTRDLNRESANRSAGNQRTSQWNHEYSQRSGGSAAPRSAPPAGGGMRGGGGGMRGGGGRR